MCMMKELLFACAGGEKNISQTKTTKLSSILNVQDLLIGFNSFLFHPVKCLRTQDKSINKGVFMFKVYFCATCFVLCNF